MGGVDVCVLLFCFETRVCFGIEIWIIVNGCWTRDMMELGLVFMHGGVG